MYHQTLSVLNHLLKEQKTNKEKKFLSNFYKFPSSCWYCWKKKTLHGLIDCFSSLCFSLWGRWHSILVEKHVREVSHAHYLLRSNKLGGFSVYSALVRYLQHMYRSHVPVYSYWLEICAIILLQISLW